MATFFGDHPAELDGYISEAIIWQLDGDFEILEVMFLTRSYVSTAASTYEPSAQSAQREHPRPGVEDELNRLPQFDLPGFRNIYSSYAAQVESLRRGT